MPVNKFRRYLWLMGVLKSGPITFDEINRRWINSKLNQEDQADLPKKTFFNHCQAISEIFDVEIVCDRKNDYKYHIDDTYVEDKWLSSLLNDLVIHEAIREDSSMQDKILDLDVKVEPRLPQFVNLIKDKAAIRFRFFADCSYERSVSGTDEPKDIEMIFSPFFPLGLVQAERCWFVIGLFARKNGWRRYSVYKVEHVTDITVIPELTIPDYPENFTPKEFLDNFVYPQDFWFDETDLLLIRLGSDIPDKIPWMQELSNKGSDQ